MSYWTYCQLLYWKRTANRHRGGLRSVLLGEYSTARLIISLHRWLTVNGRVAQEHFPKPIPPEESFKDQFDQTATHGVLWRELHHHKLGNLSPALPNWHYKKTGKFLGTLFTRFNTQENDSTGIACWVYNTSKVWLSICWSKSTLSRYLLQWRKATVATAYRHGRWIAHCPWTDESGHHPAPGAAVMTSYLSYYNAAYGLL